MSFFARLGARKKELQQLWKPIGLILFFITLLRGFTEFRHRTGPYFYAGSAFFILAVAILFTMPDKSIRLLARRLVAFAIDLVLFALFTIAIGRILFAYQAVRQSAVVSMTIVWLWFVAFVLLDWQFAGTPGQALLGLRLRNAAYGMRTNSYLPKWLTQDWQFSRTSGFFRELRAVENANRRNPTLLKCVARNLLSVLVPVVLAGRIVAIGTSSRIGEFVVWTAAVAILAVIPFSIAFCGGHALPDLLLGLTVLPKRANADPHAVHVTKWRSLASFIASLLLGMILASAQSLTASLIERKTIVPPVQVFRESSQADAETAQRLRLYLNPGMPSVDTLSSYDYLQDLRLSSAFGQLPTVDEELAAPVACMEPFKTKPVYEIVRVQINPETPMLIRAPIFHNLLKVSDLYMKRPGFLVLEISSKDTYGVFNFEKYESYVLCETVTGGQQENSLVDVTITVSFPYGSISEPAILVLGMWDSYSYTERVPIWSS